MFFFFNAPASTEIYTLSLHDALPISRLRATSYMEFSVPEAAPDPRKPARLAATLRRAGLRDRKSTRLNSSHSQISYAVFCLKKKKTIIVLSGFTNSSSFLFHHFLSSI